MNYLERWDAARTAIAECRNVDEVKKIRDQAEALRVYARQAGESLQVQNDIAEIKLRAERRAGEILREMPKAGGGRPTENPSKASTGFPLSDLGISRDESSRFQRVASLPTDVFEAHIASVKDANAELTTASVLRVAQALARESEHATLTPRFIGTPQKYSVIYCDPPWSYNDKAANTGRWGGALNHYPCMSIGELCAMQINIGNGPERIRDIAAPDALLFMWVTAPLLEDSFRVIESWGFEYKTFAFVWVKRNADGTPYFGMGNYTRQNAEICLLARKGSGILRQSASVSSIIESSRGEHSAKPEGVRDRIVELCGDVPRIELFAREKVDGWDVYGNEAKQEALPFTREA